VRPPAGLIDSTHEEQDVIQIHEAVTLLLPFQCRTLRLSHRLLESLGGVSRFILSALSAGLNLEQVAEVSGLPEAALGRQLAFLSQHGFVDVPAEGRVPALGERGRRILEVERLLEHDLHPVWLDAFTLRQQVVLLLAGLEPGALLPEPPATGPCLAAVMPRRTRAYLHFDEMNRLRTLLDAQALAGLLETLWPGSDALIQEELDHWDYELLRLVEPEIQYLPLSVPAGGLGLSMGASGRDPAWPLVSLPVLELETCFSRDPSLSWSIEVPETEHHLIELVSNGLLGPRRNVGDEPADARVLVLPARTHGAGPNLPPVALPVGVSAVVKARQHRLICSMDGHAILTRLAEVYPDEAFCSAGRKREEMAA